MAALLLCASPRFRFTRKSEGPCSPKWEREWECECRPSEAVFVVLAFSRAFCQRQQLCLLCHPSPTPTAPPATNLTRLTPFFDNNGVGGHFVCTRHRRHPKSMQHSAAECHWWLNNAVCTDHLGFGGRSSLLSCRV